ncbi:MAG: fibronectin type III domain-containing protein [Acidobacteriaceae bacterium]|jgi:hypothetical protein
MSVFALAGAGMLPAQVTTINVNNTVLHGPVKRFGINLGATNYYDSGQMMKNLIINNPGFEGQIAQSMVQCGSGTATSCTQPNYYSAWPNHFWDGATYQFIYGNAIGRSGTVANFVGATGTAGGIFNFADSGTASGQYDYMIVKKPMPGNATDGWTPYNTGAGTITTNSTDLSPTTEGTQSAFFNAPSTGDSASLTAYFDSTAGHTFVQLNGQYQLTFSAKGLGNNPSVLVDLVRNSNPAISYIFSTVNLTNEWQTYTLTFDATENGSAIGTAQLYFGTVGADSFYLDDVSLVQLNSDPTNTTVFRDPVVDALQQLNPGVMRFWFNQLGETLDNMLAPPLGRQRSTYSSYATDVNFVEYGLTDFLQLCQKVGADPWVVVPITLSNAEASNLIDYLAGGANTVYGAKRIAAGQTAPWTSVFKTIHLEFGNEAWDTLFNGGDMEISAAYGTRSQAVFAAMRANTNYTASSFDLIMNGFAAYPPANTTIQSYCDNNDSFASAPYMMYTINDPTAAGYTGAAYNENLFGSTFAEAEAFVTDSGTAEGVADGYILQNQLAIQAYNKPYITTEFNISPKDGTITQAELNGYASSVGAGLAVGDAMLQQLRAGVLTQNLFQLAGFQSFTTQSTPNNINLWGSVVDMGVTNRRRPQFLAEELANNAIATNTATMLQTVHTGADPTWNQALVQDVQLNNAHYLESFAFNNGNQYSLVIFNTHRTSALPVTFAGENIPAGTVQMQQLTSANLTDTNEESLLVAPVSSTLSSFNPSASFSLPPYSMTVLTWTAPLISNVTVSGITATSATITWSTDVAASGQVNYGTTASYGSKSALNGASTTQSITLTGLTPGQAYDFAVSATNAAGAIATSANATFTTTSGTFTLSAPASITLQQGALGSYAVTVTKASGFSGSVTLSLTGLPSGATDTFTTTSTGATLAISLPATAPVATYPLTLKGASGSATISTPISLAVTQIDPIAFDPCAVDYGTCTIPQGTTANVYYGVNGKYLQRVLTGTFVCSPATFGSDPDQGVLKSCYPIVIAPPAVAVGCAVDYGTCTLPAGSSAVVYYGVNQKYVYKTLSGTFSCSPSTFGGDPDQGVLKTCYPVISSPPSTAKVCATEGGTCKIPSGSKVVYFGANSTYLDKSLSGTFTCEISTFGSDPDVGTLKSCLY